MPVVETALVLKAMESVSLVIKEGLAHERYMMEQMSDEKRRAYADAWADPKIWWQTIMSKFGDLIDGGD